MGKYSVFAVLLLLIGLGVFYVLLPGKTKKTENVKSMPTVAPVTSSVLPAQPPDKIVRDFYSKYIDCAAEPPQAAEGQVVVYCQNHAGFTTADFAKNIQAVGVAKAGVDPIVCSPDFPENAKVDNTSILGNKATVTVTELFGGDTVTLSVDLIVQNNQWFVSSINCPKS